MQLVSAAGLGDLIDGDSLQGIAYREMAAYDEEFHLGFDKRTQELRRERGNSAMTESQQNVRWSDTHVEKVLEHWRSARRDSRGLEIQRRLAARLMNPWLRCAELNGRRIGMKMVGGSSGSRLAV